jgi:hypothetical protein
MVFIEVYLDGQYFLFFILVRTQINPEGIPMREQITYSVLCEEHKSKKKKKNGECRS